METKEHRGLAPVVLRYVYVDTDYRKESDVRAIVKQDLAVFGVISSTSFD